MEQATPPSFRKVYCRKMAQRATGSRSALINPSWVDRRWKALIWRPLHMIRPDIRPLREGKWSHPILCRFTTDRAALFLVPSSPTGCQTVEPELSARSYRHKSLGS